MALMSFCFLGYPSVTPSICSRSFTAELTADCDSAAVSPAAAVEPVLATAENSSSCRSENRSAAMASPS
ncbi:protein of unknown function (plasmid) [Cupriavidus neocaledonicus]|uniref:Uncharacterized protein n=1 Tax=Cupriavidus neocaledonicus TaxID=1040979 RepID=A0A375HVZ8_9BURK|nr:hypothetical protein CBM2605_B40092 [Cupriavidus neocaledonicus]SPA41632.1 protein of unknown function [Cupriavidus taiwanensis]SPD60907.1 protein of unknown function [Cupriavidus neocaledonicus]